MIAYQGTPFRVKNIRGLHYIAHLLRRPHQECHVFDLVAVTAKGLPASSSESLADLVQTGLRITAEADAGEVLDQQARTAYRRRLRDLEEELQEAQTGNDFARVTKVQEEIAFLTQQLAAGVGWRGHSRRAVSHTERARVNITNGIRAALAKIAEHDPSLSHYLSLTITTGLFCSFTPDPSRPIMWQF